MARLLINPEAVISPKGRDKLLLAVIGFGLCFVIPGIGCGSGSSSGNGFSKPTPVPVTLAVSPSSIAVLTGSTATFTASPSPPQGFSLSWSVNPPSAGTITSSGVFTASQTAGSYIVVATWIPNSSSLGNRITGSATVMVLQPAALNLDLIEASGLLATAAGIQNASVVGENLPAVTSTDPSGKTQANTGFPIPVLCPQSDPGCH